MTEYKPISSVSRTREILRTYDLRAKKGYGQNFLTDVSVVARCAEAAHVEDAVIEVGPGIGALTEQLAQRSKHVLAFEVDERLPSVLADTLSPYDNVEIRLQDFLTADITTVVKELKDTYGHVSLAANLPYYITTPILFKVFEDGGDIEWITVMVQREVADRFSAKPGSKEYGALSVEAQLLYDVQYLFTVNRKSFDPVPGVDSAIVQFHRKEIVIDDTDRLFELVRGCFTQRRKTIYNNLKEYLADSEKATQLLEKVGIEPSVRAQNLAPEVFLQLHEVLQSL